MLCALSAAILAFAPPAWAKLDILGETHQGTAASAQSALSNLLGKPQTPANSTDNTVAQTNEATVTLVAHAPQGIQPGGSFELGLWIQHSPQWHTYWQNPGDSGLPTRLEPTLPADFSVKPLKWPTPHAIPIGRLTNYGYEQDVLLASTVRVPGSYTPQGEELTIPVYAYWLVCKEVCVPQDAQLSITLPHTPYTDHAALFDAASRAYPSTDTSSNHSATLTVTNADALTADATTITLRADNLPTNWRGRTLAAYPTQIETYSHALDRTQRWLEDGGWEIDLPLQSHRLDPINDITLVLSPLDEPHHAAIENNTAHHAIQVSASLDTPLAAPERTNTTTSSTSDTYPTADTPAETPNTAVSSPTQTTTTPITPTNSGTSLTLLSALAFAMLGGAILNLMPCVFPVLAIKALTFVKAHSPKQRIADGMAYSVGVILSFVALGLLLWMLRSAGAAIGWGFQLQSPWFVSGLAVLYLLIALNLAGWFELHSLLPSRIANFQSRHALLNSFLSGILAVAIASPCTAPLMGAALGYALGLPVAHSLLIFAALGIGMTLPYVLLSCIPKLAQWLPQPGAWMERFKQFMVFPMLLTIVLLLLIAGLQVSIYFAMFVLLLLICISMAMWARQLQHQGAKWALIALALGIAAAAYWQGARMQLWNTETTTTAQTNDATSTSESNADTNPKKIGNWQPWSQARVDELTASGTPYFIDYTAAWCITCQYNKANILSDPDVLKAFADRDVRLLRADWTRNDPAITRSLQKLGRAGVPVYVLHLPQQSTEVLSEVLDKEDLLGMLYAG